MHVHIYKYNLQESSFVVCVEIVSRMTSLIKQYGGSFLGDANSPGPLSHRFSILLVSGWDPVIFLLTLAHLLILSVF